VLNWRVLLLLCGALLATPAAPAQPAGKVYRVGYLGYTASNTPDGDRNVAAFVQRFRDLGIAEGDNLVIEWRFAEGQIERYTEFAAEMVRLKADVVVVGSGSAARAVMAASRTLPIVTIAVPDPVRSGLVASLARPGGQLTGLSNLADELTPKRLELLKAALPGARRIAFARCPRCLQTSGASEAELAAVRAEQEAAARQLGVTWLPLDINSAADFDAATTTLRRERPDAILIGATPVNAALRDKWVALAAELRLPMLAPYRGFGALMSYGPEYGAVFRKAAEYVVKILQGANPGELPMEQPTKFELVINLKTAKALGLTIPRSLLVRADEVIR
jgi:putative tryptophan/tyrosine transport system substrate-binding protein